MKSLKTEFKYDFADGMIQLIDTIAAGAKDCDDDEKLLIASLIEVRNRLYQKLINHKAKYTISLTPVQALSLRILYIDYLTTSYTGYLNNRLRQISEEVEKTYC